MQTLHQQLQKADRLTAITQQVGFALWQLQELEGTTAQYFILVTQAKLGMHLAAGSALVEEAQSKTFGTTIHQLAKAQLLPTDLEARFRALLAERNWLVHSSRASNRNAIHSNNASSVLLERLERIADESHVLLEEVNKLAEVFVKEHGVRAEQIDAMVSKLLEQWHGNDAI